MGEYPGSGHQRGRANKSRQRIHSGKLEDGVYAHQARVISESAPRVVTAIKIHELYAISQVLFQYFVISDSFERLLSGIKFLEFQ